MSTELQVQPSAPAPTRAASITAGARGLQLTSLEDMYRFAKYVKESGLAPKGMDKEEAILVAVQMGLEIGLTPMAAIQNIAVINGRPSLWGDAMLAVCKNSGVFDESSFAEGFEQKDPKNADSYTAFCVVRRLPDGKPVRREFSVKDAKRACLWMNEKRDPWVKYPQRMLQMRARAWALRDTFTDFLRGIYSAEEASDIEHVRDVKVTTVATSTLPELTKSERTAVLIAGGNSPSPQPFPPSAIMPDFAGESAHVATEGLPEQAGEPAASVRATVPEAMLTELFDAKTIADCNAIEEKWTGDSVGPDEAKARIEACLARKGEIRRERQSDTGQLFEVPGNYQ